MENKVFYRDQDITFILLTKVEHVARIFAEQKNMSFDEALEHFVSSNTHRTLLNPESLLWTESSEYLIDIFMQEEGTDAANSSFPVNLADHTQLT